MFAFIIAIVVALLLWSYFNLEVTHRDDKVHDLIKSLHKYSGLDPALFTSSIEDIHYLQDNGEGGGKDVVSAIENFKSFSLKLPNGDSEHGEHINEISDALGSRMDTILLQKSIKEGVSYTPKFINNELNDENEVWESN